MRHKGKPCKNRVSCHCKKIITIAIRVYLNRSSARNSWSLIFVSFLQESQEGAINIQRYVRPRRNLGFRLSSDTNPQSKRLSEDAQRVKENNDVKVVLGSFTYAETNTMVQ